MCSACVYSYLQSSMSTWWTVHSCWNMQLYRRLDWRSVSTRYVSYCSQFTILVDLLNKLEWSSVHLTHKQFFFLARCDPPCQNGGHCSAPNRCTCPNRWQGKHCERGTNQAAITERVAYFNTLIIFSILQRFVSPCAKTEEHA